MNIPCVIDHPPTCFDGPLANLSSETPDARRYLAITYAQRGCVGMCWSEISQWEAYLCALAQESLCDGLGETNSVEQSCASACPDGGEFTFVIPAGAVYGETPADANRRAYDLCCQQARLMRVCCPPLQMQACVGDDTTFTITPEGNVGESMTFEIVAGALPPGLSLAGGPLSATIAGIPTTTGRYTFTLRARTSVATYSEREYTIDVYQILSATLDDALLNTAYTDTATADGPTTGTWGALDLPNGLTINGATGVIAGTPTESGTFTVTLIYFIE